MGFLHKPILPTYIYCLMLHTSFLAPLESRNLERFRYETIDLKPKYERALDMKPKNEKKMRYMFRSETRKRKEERGFR